MKIKCTVEFAAEIYIALLYAEKRLTVEAEAYYQTADWIKSKDIYTIRDQLCVFSETIRDQILLARASGRSVSLSLELGPPSITTPG